MCFRRASPKPRDARLHGVMHEPDRDSRSALSFHVLAARFRQNSAGRNATADNACLPIVVRNNCGVAIACERTSYLVGCLDRRVSISVAVHEVFERLSSGLQAVTSDETFDCASDWRHADAPFRRNGLKNRRISAASRSGFSIAAKCPPLGMSVHCTTSKVRSSQLRGGRLSSFGKRA